MNKTKSTHATYGIIYEDNKRNRFFIHSLVENSMIPIDIVHLLPTNKRYKPERGQNPYLIAIAWSFINRLGWYDRIRRIIDRIFFPKSIQLVSTIKSSFNKYTCISCKNINDQKVVDYVRTSNVDYWLVLDSDIVRKPLLETGKQFLNSHKGYLPNVRGLSSTKWSVLTNKPFGASVHLMDSGIDTGPIVYREEFPITNTNVTDDQLNPEWQMQKTTIQKALESIFAGNTKFHPQEMGTYFSSIHPILAEYAGNLQANKKEKGS
tara:strand:- start:14706 stop:15497 length:792 start_codon:yes stop_codon:yes gene_type:complete